MAALNEIINARGTFTPLGVSRSSPTVRAAVADALSRFAVIDELQNRASRKLAEWAGAEAATVTHCAAASVTLTVAAAIAGSVPERIGALPDATGLRGEVVIPAGHCVNYGAPIEQAIRLSGAKPVRAGSLESCSLADIESQIDRDRTCCLMLVSSKLVKSEPIDLAATVAIARSVDVPTIIDGAAQDFRIEALLETGADAVIVSAQKYLAGPTAGLVIGRADLIDAVRAQDKGIGRGMKASKEAIAGVLAAIEERQGLDLAVWKRAQAAKLTIFVSRVGALAGLDVVLEPDPTGLPFSRAYVRVDAATAGKDAPTLMAALKAGDPSVWTLDDKASEGRIGFELVQCTDAEIDAICARLTALVS